MKNNKILHITTAHKNDDVRIFHKEVLSLKKKGFNVSLIAQGQKDEIVNGVNIYHVPCSKNRVDRFLFTNIRILFRIIKINPKICHFHDPDFILGAFFLRLLGKKIIYDVHEDVPKQIMSKYWIPKILRKLISISFNIFEKIISNIFFSSIVVATPDIAKNFSNKKTITVMNYPVLDKFHSDINFNQKENSIIYIGSISESRGIKELLLAFKNINDDKINLYIAGNFENKIIEEEVMKQIDDVQNIIYLGFLNWDDIIKYLSKSKIGIVTLHPIENYITSYPIKLFEYMAMELAVIGSNFPLWEDIIVSNECGLVVDPLQPKEIAQAINDLINDPDKIDFFGSNGKKNVFEKFNWKIEEKKLIKLYLRILDEN